MRRTYFLLPAFALTLLLSACGSIEQPQAATSSDAAASTSSAASEPAASGPVTLTDARDKQITLDAPAAEVVGLEWGVVENLVSLGAMPVGVADVTGYTNWVSAAPLDDGVEDIGTRGEPASTRWLRSIPTW